MTIANQNDHAEPAPVVRGHRTTENENTPRSQPRRGPYFRPSRGKLPRHPEIATFRNCRKEVVSVDQQGLVTRLPWAVIERINGYKAILQSQALSAEATARAAERKR